MYHPTFADISHDESTAVRCLNLIERHAARFIGFGGGGLSQECPVNRRTLTSRDRADIRRRLLETGGRQQAQIGRDFGGFSQRTVHKIWKEMSA